MRSRTWRLWAVAAVLAGGGVRTGLAWGPAGHEIVGIVAERQLTPAARREVDHLLGDLRLGDDKVANWADYIRGTQKWARQYPQNAVWHYVDIDLDATGVPEGGTNVVQAIRLLTEVLRTSADHEARVEALKFLVHFVGDIHQPLHCAHRNDDRGGNLQFLTSFTGRTVHATCGRTPTDPLNLHMVWDICLVDELLGKRTAATVAQELMAGGDGLPKGAAGGLDPAAWAWESHLLARSKAYAWGAGAGDVMPSAGPIALTPENYITDRTAVVREQLRLAGLRLGALLNAVLAPAAPADSEGGADGQ